MKTEMTVLEAINYAIENGIEQAKKQLEAWEKRSRLMKNEALSLERSLLQLNETVEFNGYGKRGKVTLGAELSQIAKRSDGRENNGREITIDETIFMEEVHVALYRKELAGTIASLTTWSRLFKIEKMETTEEQIDLLTEVYNIENQKWFNARIIADEFARDYNKKMNVLIANTFKRLKKAGKIDYIEQPYGVKDEVKNEITAEVYRDFYNRQKELIEQYGYRYQQYMGLSSLITQKHYKNEKLSLELTVFLGEQEEIQATLVEEFGYEYVYMAYQVTDVEEIKEEDLTPIFFEDSLEKTFINYYINTTKKYRYENYKEYYAESTWFWRSFFYLSATILLDKTDAEVMANFEADLEQFLVRHDEQYRAKVAEVFGMKALAKDRNIFLQERKARKALEKYEMNLEIKNAMDEYHRELGDYVPTKAEMKAQKLQEFIESQDSKPLEMLAQMKNDKPKHRVFQ